MQVFLWALALVPLLSWQDGELELEKRKVKDFIEVHVPAAWQSVPPKRMPDFIEAARPPLALYRPQDGKAMLSIGQNYTNFRGQDMSLLRDFQKANVMSLYNNHVRWYKNEIREINGRKFVIFSFIGTMVRPRKQPIRKFNTIAYTVYEGRLVNFSFSCEFRERDYWRERSLRIIESVELG